MILEENLNNTLEEDLSSFIQKDVEFKISNKALYTAFKQRTKIEYLKFFIV
ncbi:hypothetical protein IKB17_00785 [bacterium]|nr:hypothetical protein [bacterium]